MIGKVKSMKKVQVPKSSNSFHNHHFYTLTSGEIQAMIDEGIDDKEKLARVMDALAFVKANEGKPKELEWLDK